MFAVLGPFGDAIQFIFEQRESQAGTVQVGGLAETWELTWTHVKLSLAATAIATLVAMPIGVWLGHIGRYQFLAISVAASESWRWVQVSSHISPRPPTRTVPACDSRSWKMNWIASPNGPSVANVLIASPVPTA